MISALAHSGRLEEARDAVRSLLEVQPNANLSLVRTIAWQHPWMVALVVDGLRPVDKGSIGYKVAEEIVALAPNGSMMAPAKGAKRAKA